jgi:mannosyl-oligosaccharide alpha-1,2-mannosidase
MNPFLRRWSLFIIVALCLVFSLLRYSESVSWDVFEPKVPASSSSDAGQRTILWKDVPQRYPVSSMIRLPSGTPMPIPKIQHDFQQETAQHKKERLKRLDAVKESFLHSWKGYKKHAWLQDEVAPVSGGYKNGFGGWGATLVDSLDTLSIMGLRKEFAVAVAALKKIDFSKPQAMEVNVFETTIRYLGGLLSAHDLSEGKYPILLEKATELGQMLYAAFDTPNRMPITRWSWEEYVALT